MTSFNISNRSLTTLKGIDFPPDIDELDSNEDFAPLFVVRELLKLYTERTRKFLEEPEEDKFEPIKALQTAIGYVGEVYRDNLNRRLNELRQIPGYEDFRIHIVDYKGAHFVM